MLAFAVVALVRALSLPVGFTVDPEGATPQIAVSANGSVAALAHSTDRTFRTRAFRWRNGTFQTFSGLPVLTAPGGAENAKNDPTYRVDAAGVASAGPELLVTASTSWSGAYSGVSFEVQRWGAFSAARWSLPSCVVSGDSYDQHAYGGDSAGRVALTIDQSGADSFEIASADSGYVPYAFVVQGSHCRDLGRATVQGVNGEWAAGYRPHAYGKRTPHNVNVAIARTDALRWYGQHVRELGRGDAIAVNALGLTVGADAVPPMAPHAIVWTNSGKRIAIAPRSPRSVAYAVNDDGTVVGMVMDSRGRHFAFRWHNGVLQRLDDLPHPPGWRFECAYAVARDGTITGIGTLDGIAEVFVWREPAATR